MPYVESQTQEFLDQLNSSNGPPLESLSPEDARGVLESVQESIEYEDFGTKVEVYDTPHGTTVTVVKPKKMTKELKPGFMFVHGGGWILGDFDTHERLITDIVLESGFVGIYLDYSRSPEKQFPTAINELSDSAVWVHENAESFGVDKDRMAVVGNSVGGNMSAVLALLTKDLDLFRCQVLLWPVTSAGMKTKSYKDFAKGYFLTADMMKWFWNSYADKDQKKHEMASVLTANIDKLQGLPPALIITAENDVLRDEGEAYAAALNKADVPVISVRYDGMIHDFGLLNPLSEIPAVRMMLKQVADMLKMYC